jgi:hypothetical protein
VRAEDISAEHALSCKMHGLVHIHYDDNVGDEFGHLSLSRMALFIKSRVTHKPRINRCKTCAERAAR